MKQYNFHVISGMLMLILFSCFGTGIIGPDRTGADTYDFSQTKLQYYEYMYMTASESNDADNVVLYGEKILELSPDRLPIMVNLATAYLKMGMTEISNDLYTAVIQKSKDDAQFMEQNKSILSKLSLALAVEAKKNQNFFASYTLADQANDMDYTVFSRNDLYRAAMDMVTELNQDEKYFRAMEILEMMKKKFGASGRWCNDMAWQLFLADKDDPDALEKAYELAMEAVHILENSQPHLLDLAYDTLSEIAYAQKNVEGACDFNAQAALHAPEERKHQYQNRFDCP